ncbi:MAG: M28 family peptidase [Bacteroidetes bacterium]|nr:MAG: M28 family peptidase [Bacteroidota bacterium]
MKRLLLAAALWLPTVFVQAQSDSAFIAQLFEQALSKGKAYSDLRDLCKQAGPRLSGSPAAAKAVQLTAEKMRNYAFDSVFFQDVMVPYWVRNEETALKLSSSDTGFHSRDLPLCALGGSVAGMVSGEVVEVLGWNDLQKLPDEQVKGKIVFFNRPMDARMVYTFGAYGTCVDQRVYGAIWAASKGAKGILVRSMNLSIDDYPHTGSMAYVDTIAKIPAAAISTQGAEELSALLVKYPNLSVSYALGGENKGMALSHNVIGELKGKKKDIIAVGGHLDAWDMAEGAHDDGAGCIQSIEVLRLLKTLNYTPNYTLRSVMWMNEENGLKGALAYAHRADSLKENHVAAIEADRGAFAPRGFFIQADQKMVERMQTWLPLLEPYGVYMIKSGGAGADVGPLARVNEKTVLVGFVPDSQRYFDYHHAATDTFESVNKRELELGAAALASLIYLMDKYEVGSWSMP